MFPLTTVRVVHRRAAVALAAAALAGGGWALNGPIGAQQPVRGKTVETKAAKSRGTGPDANVKRDSLAANNAAAASPAPPSKGGPKTRGAYASELHIDNRTSWNIRIYVDGDYVGSVSPYGDSYGFYSCANHSVYARAYFTTGEILTWGPNVVDMCEDQTWRLRSS